MRARALRSSLEEMKPKFSISGVICQCRTEGTECIFLIPKLSSHLIFLPWYWKKKQIGFLPKEIKSFLPGRRQKDGGCGDGISFIYRVLPPSYHLISLSFQNHSNYARTLFLCFQMISEFWFTGNGKHFRCCLLSTTILVEWIDFFFSMNWTDCCIVDPPKDLLDLGIQEMRPLSIGKASSNVGKQDSSIQPTQSPISVPASLASRKIKDRLTEMVSHAWFCWLWLIF